MTNGSWCCCGAILLQDLQLYLVSLMPLFNPVQYILSLAQEHILVTPWWATCNADRTYFLIEMGITI